MPDRCWTSSVRLMSNLPQEELGTRHRLQTQAGQELVRILDDVKFHCLKLTTTKDRDALMIHLTDRLVVEEVVRHKWSLDCASTRDLLRELWKRIWK